MHMRSAHFGSAHFGSAYFRVASEVAETVAKRHPAARGTDRDILMRRLQIEVAQREDEELIAMITSGIIHAPFR